MVRWTGRILWLRQPAASVLLPGSVPDLWESLARNNDPGYNGRSELLRPLSPASCYKCVIQSASMSYGDSDSRAARVASV